MPIDPKQQGIVFEALTYLALCEFSPAVHWGIKPKGFSIDPDFLLGDLQHPHTWILVTSTGSAKNFDSKFWRNVDEIALAKTSFKTPPRMINIVFKDTQKPGLQDAIARLCDEDIRITDEDFGRDIIEFTDALSQRIPADNYKKVQVLKEELRQNRGFRVAYRKFRERLERSVDSKAAGADGLWQLLRSTRRTSSFISVRPNSVRRGIAKLMVVPAEFRESMFRQVRTEHLMKAKIPLFLFDLGFVESVHGGAKVSDQDLLAVLARLPFSDIERVIALSPIDKMRRWIAPLSGLSNVALFTEYVIARFRKLCSVAGMTKCLLDLHRDPYSGLDRTQVSGQLETVWLFYFLFDVAKALSGKRQGFGLSSMGKLAQAHLSEKLWAPNNRVWTIVTSDFINRVNKEDIPTVVLQAQAGVLASLLENCGVQGLRAAHDKIVAMTVVSNLEQKLIPYRLFEPLPILIEASLNAGGLPFQRIRSHPTVIGEVVGKPARVGTIPVIACKNTLIHWKSAPKNPRDKTKELCGRVRSLRVTFRSNTFSWRFPSRSLVLVLDGAFSAKHLEALQIAGWDKVLFADELDKLVALIK